MTAMGSRLVRTGVAMLLALAVSVAPVAAQVEPHAETLELRALVSDVPGRDVDRSQAVGPDVPVEGQATQAAPTATIGTDPTLPPAAGAPLADAPPALLLPALPAPDIHVTESQLLSVVSEVAGSETITPTTVIPYIVDRSCYNWVVKFHPVEGDLLLTEELRLPGPARNWGTEGGTTEVNRQGSAAVTRRHFDAATGVAMAGWCVAKADPVGAYRYIIRQGDREVARFDFTVGDLL